VPLQPSQAVNVGTARVPRGRVGSGVTRKGVATDLGQSLSGRSTRPLSAVVHATTPGRVALDDVQSTPQARLMCLRSSSRSPPCESAAHWGGRWAASRRGPPACAATAYITGGTAWRECRCPDLFVRPPCEASPTTSRQHLRHRGPAAIDGRSGLSVVNTPHVSLPRGGCADASVCTTRWPAQWY